MNDVVRDGMLFLAKRIGSGVLSIPISVVPGDANAPRAYTNDFGIVLRSDVVEKRPQDVPALIGHELWHHVIRDDSVRARFPMEVVNYAEDYKINLHMLDLFGIDVRRIKGGCLFDRDLGSMSVEAACRKLIKVELDASLAQSPVGISCAEILRVARHLRSKYADTVGVSQRIFHVDVIDEELFINATHKLTKALSVKMALSPLAALEALWQRFYLPKPVGTEKGPARLSPEQALAYAHPAGMVRPKTRQRADDAAIAALVFLNRASDDARYISAALLSSRSHLSVLRNKLRFAIKMLGVRPKKGEKKWKVIRQRDITAIEKRIARTQNTIKRWAHMKSLAYNLVKHPVRALPRVAQIGERRPTTLSMANARPERDSDTDSVIPRLKRNATVDSIHRVARRADRDFQKLQESLDYITQAGFPMDESMPGDSSEESMQDGSNPENEQEAGRGEGAPSRVNVAQTLLKGNVNLARILSHMNEMITLLARTRTRRSNEFSHDAATRYSYGSDLERVLPESLALLDRQETKLAFLSELAAGSLPQRTPPDRKRYPVCICVDSSGSMQGENYETAAGFALATIALLQKDRRGVALIMFSDSAYKTVIVRPGQPLDIHKALETLIIPRVGGTNFDAPLMASFDVRDQLRWRNVLTMVVTDGQCAVTDRAAVLERKRADDRILAVISNRNPANLSGLADNVYVAKRNGLETELVEAGRGIL